MRVLTAPGFTTGIAKTVLAAGAFACVVLTTGCAALEALWPTPRRETVEIGPEIYRRAEVGRSEQLAREVERLRADLRQAEDALVTAESGLRGHHTRADAVSTLAEARIRVERAAQEATWRSPEIEEARAKLAEADRQIGEGHFGLGLFFVYRAQRIADFLESEALQVRSTEGTHFIRGSRVNVRAGPSTDDAVLIVLTTGTPVFPEGRRDDWVLVRATSGAVGWVHDSLLR